VKQTIVILTALAAVLLLATSFIVAANMDLSRKLETQEREILSMTSKLEKQGKELERSAEEKASSAETLRKTMEERDALSKQLNDAVLASQEANEAVEQQILQNEKQLREMASLAAEYEDLSLACDALEARVLSLSEEAAQAAMSHQAQTLADAERIAELEAELEKAIAVTSIPAPAPSPVPEALAFPQRSFMPLVTVTPMP